MKILRVILASSVATMIVPPAQAQDVQNVRVDSDESILGDIIVTATRRSERLQDVPVSVSAISGDQLSARGVIQTNDLAAVVPNLQINTQYGDTQPNFTLRGVGVANEFNVNTASPVGIYVDEVYQAFRFSHGQQLYDLERVEVLRGPQGTLYGRNTTGGAVNIITRKPELDGSNGYIMAGYGNYDRWKAEGAVELTAIPDKLGFRLAMTRTKSDGYFREANPAASRNNISRYQNSDSWGARLTMRAKLGENVDVLVKGFYAKDDPIGPARYVIPYPGATDIAGYSRFARGLGEDEFEMNEMGRFLTRTAGASLSVSWTQGDFSITSVTGYADGKFSLQDETDGTPNSLVNIDYFSNTSDFNQDIRMNYDGDKLKFIIGGYYGKDKLKSANPLRFYNILPDATSLVDLNPVGLFDPSAPQTSFNVLQTYGQNRRSMAVYSEATYSFTDRLDLTLGLRFTNDKIEYQDGRSEIYTDFPGIPLLPIFSNVNDKAKSNKWSGRAILNYKWSDGIRTYASFSRGYRSGTYNGFAYADPNQTYFVPPEKLDSYEFGIKSRLFDDRIQMNAAAFYYDYQNQQVSEIVGAVAFLRSASATVKGFEAELLAKPVQALTLRASLGYLDTEYKKNQVIGGKDIGGNQLPFASKWTWNIGGDLKVAKFDIGDLVLNAEAQYTGRYYYDLFGKHSPGNLLQQKGYILTNARISFINETWTLSAWIKNITDKRYYPVGYDLVGGFDQIMKVPGSPRTYGVEASVRF